MRRGPQGAAIAVTVGGETYTPFVPKPLPPDPPLAIEGDLLDALSKADRAVGGLDQCACLLPDYRFLLYQFVRKEAVVSSQIEGTQSSLSDLLAHEVEGAPGLPAGDVGEVVRYVAAMEHGLKRLRGGFPLSLRLVREIHVKLLSSGRGSDRDPGEFRRTQNWIAGSRPGNAMFVPPPPEEVVRCMGELEGFLHDERPGMPVLVRAALAHAQFETIHPFLDGNGRVGRLLITFLLCWKGVLSEPLLYLSLYLKQNRQAYYDHLQAVRSTGNWEAWVSFFLDGVAECAGNVVSATRRLLDMFERHRATLAKLGGKANTALRLHDLLRERPVVTASYAADRLGLSHPTVAARMADLGRLGILEETTGRKWGRRFVYRGYMDILSEGTEPLPQQGRRDGEG